MTPVYEVTCGNLFTESLKNALVLAVKFRLLSIERASNIFANHVKRTMKMRFAGYRQ